MNNVLYSQIRIFHTIAKEGSLSAAAKKLNITPPSVSKALKLLELHIGHLLFVRTTRRVELTETGMLLLQQTSEAIASLEGTLENLKKINQEPAGLIRVTLSRFAYLLIMKPLMAEFCRLYPHIQLEISVYDGIVDIIDERFDLGIRFGDILDDSVVASQLISPFREGLYASAGYIKDYGMPVLPEDLNSHKLIGYRFTTSNQILPLELEDNGKMLTIDIPGQLISNDIDVMADGIRKGFGLGRLFEPVLFLQQDKDEFIPVMENYWKTYPPVYLYYLKSVVKSGRTKLLVEFLIGKTTAMRRQGKRSQSR